MLFLPQIPITVLFAKWWLSNIIISSNFIRTFPSINIYFLSIYININSWILFILWVLIIIIIIIYFDGQIVPSFASMDCFKATLCPLD